MIPNEIKQSFLDKAHREIDFPAYLDDLALATLDTHMASGCGWIDAKNQTLNELKDGVLL